MTVPDQYSGVPFRAGSMVGVRAFAVHPVGGLTGPVYRTTWLPGVNEAKCNRNNPWSFLGARGVHHIPEHEVGALCCTCGWYAYYADNDELDYFNNDSHRFLNMLGIIEGWGRVTFGKKGFRASKARILALVEPYDVRTPRGYTADAAATTRWPAISHRYQRIPVYPTLIDALLAFPVQRAEPTHPEDGDAA